MRWEVCRVSQGFGKSQTAERTLASQCILEVVRKLHAGEGRGSWLVEVGLEGFTPRQLRGLVDDGARVGGKAP